ncbi:MAG: hypothetical protein WDW36_003817 [Sanguina aurantia]
MSDALADEAGVEECANCGTTSDLLRCSRCRSIWFCSLKCHKAYWPFHKSDCRKNEFADILDASEPKFAKWMRKHGKLAVIKDDEVERLERAGRATLGPSRDDVMGSMYGRLDPSPVGPSYSRQELLAMEQVAEKDRRQARLTSSRDTAWAALDTPLGVVTDKYKWRQNQSHVELFVLVPPNVPSHQVRVTLQEQHLCVGFSSQDNHMNGTLFHAIRPGDSTWFIDGGVLHIIMLKRSRRGHYDEGNTNASTFWFSMWAHRPAGETLQIQHPPTGYYWSQYEEDDLTETPVQKPRSPKGNAKLLQGLVVA